MTHQTKVAAVILNYNGRGYLERFLPFLKASTYARLEIWVADNCSTDGSVKYLRENHPEVRLFENRSNEGFAKGYNTALAAIDADLYILLNSDVEVTPGWIEPIASLMASESDIAACQPKILDWNDRNRFEYAGGSGGWIDALGYPFCRGRVFDQRETDMGQYDDCTNVFWASGAAMFVRAAAFREVGGFDPRFFAHQEEIDLCWRLQRTGYRIVCCPESVVYHVGGGTLPQGNPRKTFLNFRNNLVMLAKNLPMRESLWKLPLRFLLDAAAAWKALLQGDLGFFSAVVKAHAGFLAWALRHSDGRPRPKHGNAPLQGLFRGSIVWQHFVKGRRTFSEIIRTGR